MNIFNYLEKHRKDNGHRIAVSDGVQDLTWLDLWRHVHAVAVALGFQHSRPIAIVLPPSVQTLIMALGAIRSGGIWLHISPEATVELTAKVLTSSQCRIVICRKVDQEKFKSLDDVELVFVDELLSSLQPNTWSDLSLPPLDNEAPCQLFYTSGSTGHPKGVWKSHNTCCMNSQSLMTASQVTENDVSGLIGDWAFSFVRTSLFAGLIAGSRTEIHARINHSTVALAHWLRDRKVTATTTIPSLAASIARSANIQLPDLRVVTLGGERTTLPDVKALQKFLAPQSVIITSFGASEFGFLGIRKIQTDDSSPDLHSYKINPQYTVDVLDADENGIGRLLVDGPNVGGGYWLEQGPEAARFTRSTRNNAHNAYLSDDLVRLHSNNIIEWVGRCDDRVKVRGKNVYLSEIENYLTQLECITQAKIVLDPNQDNNTIIAFVVCVEPHTAIQKIRQRMQSDLQSHQIPRRIEPISCMPTNTNGKIDTKQLLQIIPAQRSIDQPPLSETERTLAAIWSDVLNVTDISVNDQFIDLGGDSLLAAELTSRVANLYAIDDPAMLLQHGSTLRAMATAIDSNTGSEHAMLTLQPLGDKCPLFIVHGGGGDIFDFLELCRLLPRDRPVYAFHRIDPGLTSVDDLAERYLGELRQKQPSGPYQVAGYSFGGAVALAMSRNLLRHGEQVHLSMLDVPLKPSATIGRCLRRFLFKRSSGKFSIGGSKHFNVWLRNRKVIRDLVTSHAPTLVRYLAQKWGDAKITAQDRRQRFTCLSFWSALAFNINEYPGAVTVYRAQDFWTHCPNDLGWSTLVGPEQLKVIPVPGNHRSMLQAPHVATLAATVSQSLDRLDAL